MKSKNLVPNWLLYHALEFNNAPQVCGKFPCTTSIKATEWSKFQHHPNNQPAVIRPLHQRSHESAQTHPPALNHVRAP